MSAPLQRKHPLGFFAAGPEMLRALRLLSDGAFKVFVYCALNASRHTGRCPIHFQELARATGKSRRSITSYLEELTQKGVCRIQPAANQHQPGVIEMAEAFWPYQKPHGPAPDPSEADFVERLRRLLLAHPIVRSGFGAADRRLAGELYRQSIPLVQVERALLLGLARKYTTWLNNDQTTAITSLHYFLPLIEEVGQVGVSEVYWTYLEDRLHHYRDRWLKKYPRSGQRSGSPAGQSVNESCHAARENGEPKGDQWCK